MRRPPLARSHAAIGVALGALLLVAVPVAAQQPTDTGTEFSPLLNAIVSGLSSLIIGGGLIAVVPEYTERTTDRIVDEPGETFLYGLGISIAMVVVVFLLAITIVGIVLVIPIVIAAAVVGQLGYLAAGRVVSDEWAVVLLTAVVVGAIAGGVPILGGLVGFVLGSMGIGAWYLDYRDDDPGSGTSGTDTGPSGIDSAPGGGAAETTDRSDVTDEWGADSRSESASTSDEDSPADEWTVGFDTDDEDEGDRWDTGIDENDGR